MADTLGSAIDQTDVLFKPDIRQFAPIIVVASVLENIIVVSGTPAIRIPEVRLDLHRVRCKLENRLRGQLPDGEFEFYYFADSKGTNPRYKVLYSADSGGRYIFFLNFENHSLRSIGDVGEYSIEVFSGIHSEIGDGEDLGRTVAKILFSRGEGFDPEAFGRELLSYISLADSWGSPIYNVELLRGLLSEP